ncbi:MAG: restriction endonuclease [Lachnospiraceae bacterium]|nr:restriction endonuclease [Lachnospiraceae bacterium]
MKITEDFVKEILIETYSEEFQEIYDKSFLLQYLDKKMKAVHGNSKTRRSLANIYAVYSILYFYQKDFYEDQKSYKEFQGYDYMQLFHFYRGLYGGSKLQNHGLNSRVNGEFRNKFKEQKSDLIISNEGKYLLHIDYLYVNGHDISKASCRIIEKYMELLEKKDHELLGVLMEIQTLTDYSQKAEKINELLTENAEARIFEIISYAILKNHYKNAAVYFGYTRDTVEEMQLQLFKTGRTNANDGGIDFVMRPVGRFFQVTEVNDYDKYLLDIDKVMHFPVTFVIKTKAQKEFVWAELKKHIASKTSGMAVLEERYERAIEEIITINELRAWTKELDNDDIDGIIRDIDVYYKLEMNLDMEEEG